MCSYVGSDILVLWHVWESFEISHSDGHVSAWSLEDLLISHHVKSVIEILWVDLPLAFLHFKCSPLSGVNVALLVLLSLVVGFAIRCRFVIADIEDQISLSWRKDRKTRETQGIWGGNPYHSHRPRDAKLWSGRIQCWIMCLKYHSPGEYGRRPC